MSAYTVERLKRVVDVFVTPNPQEKKEPTFEELFGSPSVYDFRPRVRNDNMRLTVPCMDDDDTDDYDPTEDWTPRKRKPSSNGTRHGSPRASKRGKTITKVLSPLQRELSDVALGQSQVPSTRPGYNLRPRTRSSVSSVGAIENTANATDTAVCGLMPNPLRSPKQCLACLELELDCSLEQDPLSYPCTNCNDDNLDCVVHPPPTWKRPCEECKSHHRSQDCSYSSYNYDHSKPCQFCQDRGFDCVAGPAKYLPSTVHTDGRDTQESQSSQTTTLSSKSDAIDGTSFSSFVDSPESTGFTPAYLFATPMAPAVFNSPRLPNPLKDPAGSRSNPIDLVDGKPSVPNNDSASLTGETDRSSPVELGEVEPGPPGLWKNNSSIFAEKTLGTPLASLDCPKFDSRNEPKPKLVRTELPHPLKVYHEPSEQEGQTCHWCDNFAYGIAGLGVRYPEVIETSAGEWFELRDGHTHEGRDPSRMCIQCTFKRISILLCSHGSIVPLEDSGNADVDAAYDELDKASTALHPAFKIGDGNFKETPHAWCSLCRAPAFWRCDECHPITREETFSTIPTDPGCGLRLCDYCAPLAIELHGDLEAVVEHGLKDPANETDYRADVEYILKHSENNVFCQQLFGKV